MGFKKAFQPNFYSIHRWWMSTQSRWPSTKPRRRHPHPPKASSSQAAASFSTPKPWWPSSKSNGASTSHFLTWRANGSSTASAEPPSWRHLPTPLTAKTVLMPSKVSRPPFQGSSGTNPIPHPVAILQDQLKRQSRGLIVGFLCISVVSLTTSGLHSETWRVTGPTAQQTRTPSSLRPGELSTKLCHGFKTKTTSLLGY